MWQVAHMKDNSDWFSSWQSLSHVSVCFGLGIFCVENAPEKSGYFIFILKFKTRNWNSRYFLLWGIQNSLRSRFIFIFCFWWHKEGNKCQKTDTKKSFFFLAFYVEAALFLSKSVYDEGAVFGTDLHNFLFYHLVLHNFVINRCKEMPVKVAKDSLSSQARMPEHKFPHILCMKTSSTLTVVPYACKDFYRL